MNISESIIKVEFFFDCSSPWTYIGFHNMERMVQRIGAPVIWRPILVGGVFNAVNRPLYDTRANPPVPRKAEYTQKDIEDWARYFGLTVNRPPKCGHPVNSAKCMRACIVLEPEGKMLSFARAAFEALWVDGLDLGKLDVLEGICARVDVDPQWLFPLIEQQDIKDELRANTDEVIARGAFGSPTIFVNDTDMYFGNDRIVLVEHAIQMLREREAAAGPHVRALRRDR